MDHAGSLYHREYTVYQSCRSEQYSYGFLDVVQNTFTSFYLFPAHTFPSTRFRGIICFAKSQKQGCARSRCLESVHSHPPLEAVGS